MHLSPAALRAITAHWSTQGMPTARRSRVGASNAASSAVQPLVEPRDVDTVGIDSNARVQHEIQMDLAEAKLRSLKIKRWLKTDEVALYLGITREAVKKIYQRGKISANKFCGRLPRIAK